MKDNPRVHRDFVVGRLDAIGPAGLFSASHA